MLDIDSKTVFVTGGSAGVGLAAARRFLQYGARVAISGRDPRRLEAAARALDNESRLMTIQWDVSDSARAEEVLQGVVQRFGALHVLVNNAGCNHRGTLEEISSAQLREVLDTNLLAPALLTHAALPLIRRAGGGAIVNVASLAGHVPLAHEAAYCSTKFGLRAFSLSLAQDLAGSGISCSVVSPGPVDTAFIMDELDTVPDMVLSQPMSTAEEVADLIVACARDGRPERCCPRLSGVLSDAAYLFPALARQLRPMLERRGRRARALIRARRAAGA